MVVPVKPNANRLLADGADGEIDFVWSIAAGRVDDIRDVSASTYGFR